MNIKETFFGPALFGQLFTKSNVTETNAWAGLTTLNSGSAFTTVSTNLVTSGCLILYGVSVGSVSIAAASGGAIVVNSIVDGVSFAFARQLGTAAPWNDVIMWEIHATKEG